jgi:hypothetical protein
MTGLTGALDRSNWFEPLVGFVSGNYHVRVVLSRGLAGQFLAFGVVLLGFVKGSSSLQVVFWRFSSMA